MEEPEKTNRIKLWLKRIGLAGFIFFLLKGIVWLFIFYGAVHFSGC